MAISLSRVHRGTPKVSGKQGRKATTTRRPKAAAARPWRREATAAPQSAAQSTPGWPPLSQDPLVNFDNDADVRLLSDDLEASSSSQLVGLFARRWFDMQWRRLQRNSYWLSRITHQNSWWSRVKLYPEMKVPLPSWLTQRRDLDAP